MATIAIDLDRSYEIPDSVRKSLTLRGARLQRCNLRRSRGDKCHERDKRGEGRRAPALARATCHEIEQQLGDPVSGYDELDKEAQPVGNAFDLEAFIERRRLKTLKKAAKVHRRRIRRADLQELDADAQEGAFMFNIETRFRHARERVPDLHARRRFLQDFTKFLAGQRRLDARSQALLQKCRLELCELDVLMQY